MSTTAGKRGHVNICASVLTVCLPVFPSPFGTVERNPGGGNSLVLGVC